MSKYDGNLYRLGVPDMVIQRILRYANVRTTATYSVKTAADDVRSAMARLEQNVSRTSLRDTFGTLNHDSRPVPASVNWREIMGLRRLGPVAQMDRAAVS